MALDEMALPELKEGRFNGCVALEKRRDLYRIRAGEQAFSPERRRPGQGIGTCIARAALNVGGTRRDETMRTSKNRFRTALIALGMMISHITMCGPIVGEIPTANSRTSTDNLPHANVYRVVELRRYTINPGQRDKFARYFDTWFPEAFQQLGALAVGQFLEQDKVDGFTWIRAFRSMEDFAVAKSAFYYGPVWKEHKQALNELIVDSDNVLLLTPLDAEGIAVLPAVDPVLETDEKRGRVVVQIIKAKPDSLADVKTRATTAFAKYRAAGARQAAVLVTLNTSNTFPQHPIRTDGPYLVWVGVVSEDKAVRRTLLAQMQQGARDLSATSLLQDPPETIVMTPTPRSRLRWVAESGNATLR